MSFQYGWWILFSQSRVTKTFSRACADVLFWFPFTLDAFLQEKESQTPRDKQTHVFRSIRIFARENLEFIVTSENIHKLVFEQKFHCRTGTPTNFTLPAIYCHLNDRKFLSVSILFQLTSTRRLKWTLSRSEVSVKVSGKENIKMSFSTNLTWPWKRVRCKFVTISTMTYIF